MPALIENSRSVTGRMAAKPGSINLGPFTITPVFAEGHFAGVGEVYFEQTPLRSPRLPWTFYTESELGVRFHRFGNLEIIRPDDESVTLQFQAQGEWLPRVQEADAMGDARVRTRRVEPAWMQFRWTFRRITEVIADNTWEGLAMQLELESPGHPVHWIIEDTTWEIDGEAAGCTLVQQDISTIDLEQTVRADSAFSTIERFSSDGWGGAHPMDMLPRAAGAAICDFQAKGDLALCLFTERPSLTRARLDKFSDENVIHYLDRPFFPLTEKVTTPERKLLVYRHPSPLKRHEWRNLWLDCFTEVRRRILESFDFKLELPQPAIHCHLWDEDLKQLGPKWLDPLQAALPEFKKLGYKQVYTFGVWDSITSDPSPVEPGNICCPYQFRFADAFGGAEGMKRLTDEASRIGVDVYQWFSFHLSRHAEIWKQHPEWILREANGDPWDGAYQVLWSGRFRSDYGAWMADMVKTACREAGLRGVFWDSYQNLGITCVDWSASEKAPQAEEIWRFQAELQRLGMGQRAEIITIFGVSTVAVYGFENDKFRRRLWADTLRNDDIFALMDTSPGFFTENTLFSQEAISPQLYFWMAAHRVLPLTSSHPWQTAPKGEAPHAPTVRPGGDLADAYADVNHSYNTALPKMKRLRLVENATHTLWLDDENRPSVIWGLKEAKVAHRGPARELVSGKKAVADGVLKIQPGQVWLMAD